jgi:hypothetical protein
MYSILIKNGNNTYVYATDETTGEAYAGSLADTKTKFNELLQKYPISKLVVVHNTTLTVDLNIVDVDQ